MTLAAANALLKTLEEPTAQTYFFLVTHQPGALPLTIRSRCQLLSVPTPATADSAAWLAALAGGVPPEDLELLLALAQGAPLRALELIENDFISINSQLEEHFNQITGEKTDAQAVADHWLKADPGLYLNWLKVRLEWAIKGRLAPNAWTPVTDLRGDTLHNAWGRLTLTALFERLRETQALLGQLGRGINVDLALRVLLLGFERESGPA
jgi:DNA polymerase-3 subunit delta'